MKSSRVSMMVGTRSDKNVMPNSCHICETRRVPALSTETDVEGLTDCARVILPVFVASSAALLRSVRSVCAVESMFYKMPL